MDISYVLTVLLWITILLISCALKNKSFNKYIYYLLVFLCICVPSQVGDYEKTIQETIPIVSLDSTFGNSNFFLGINDRQYSSFEKLENNQYKNILFPMNSFIIKENDLVEPHADTIKKRSVIAVWFLNNEILHLTFPASYSGIIYVPKNTIVKQFMAN